MKTIELSLSYTDREGPSTLKKIAANIGRCEATVRRAFMANPSAWECEQQLGATWGHNFKWRMIYFRKVDRSIPPMPCDVFNDPNFKGHGFVLK